MFISPSVTPWRVPFSDGTKTPPHNPAIRRFIIDEDTYEVVDYEQYSLDLEKVSCPAEVQTYFMKHIVSEISQMHFMYSE